MYQIWLQLEINPATISPGMQTSLVCAGVQVPLILRNKSIRSTKELCTGHHNYVFNQVTYQLCQIKKTCSPVWPQKTPLKTHKCIPSPLFRSKAGRNSSLLLSPWVVYLHVRSMISSTAISCKKTSQVTVTVSIYTKIYKFPAYVQQSANTNIWFLLYSLTATNSLLLSKRSLHSKCHENLKLICFSVLLWHTPCKFLNSFPQSRYGTSPLLCKSLCYLYRNDFYLTKFICQASMHYACASPWLSSSLVCWADNKPQKRKLPLWNSPTVNLCGWGLKGLLEVTSSNPCSSRDT